MEAVVKCFALCASSGAESVRPSYGEHLTTCREACLSATEIRPDYDGTRIPRAIVLFNVAQKKRMAEGVMKQ